MLFIPGFLIQKFLDPFQVTSVNKLYFLISLLFLNSVAKEKKNNGVKKILGFFRKFSIDFSQRTVSSYTLDEVGQNIVICL